MELLGNILALIFVAAASLVVAWVYIIIAIHIGIGFIIGSAFFALLIYGAWKGFDSHCC